MVAGFLGILPVAGGVYNGHIAAMIQIDTIFYLLFGGPLWNWYNQSRSAEIMNIRDAGLLHGLYEDPAGKISPPRRRTQWED